MLAPHAQLVKHMNLKMVLHNILYSKGYKFQQRFTKDLWNPLRTTRNSRWNTGGPPGPCWESLFTGFGVEEVELVFAYAWESQHPRPTIILLSGANALPALYGPGSQNSDQTRRVSPIDWEHLELLKWRCLL